MGDFHLYPGWKELVKIIEEMESENQGGFYTDGFINSYLEGDPFGWMKVCNALLAAHGMDFKRVRGKGYRVLTDQEKVESGFQRRLNKTKRNFKRMARVAASVNRNSLSEDDGRVHDHHMAQIGMLGMSLNMSLPEGAKMVKMTLEVDRELPKIE